MFRGKKKQEKDLCRECRQLFLSSSRQDTPWANYRLVKKKETPTGTQCYQFASLAAKATWAELVTKARSSSEFKSMLSEAKQRLARPPPEPGSEEFLLEEVHDKSEATVPLGRSLLFLSTIGFQQEHGLTPAQAGISTLEMMEETGGQIVGVLVDDGEARRLTIEVRQGLQLSRLVAKESDMLRPEQNTELYRYLLNEQDKAKPKHSKAPITLEGLKAAVSAAKSKPAPEVPAARAPLETAAPRQPTPNVEEDMPAPLLIAKVGPAPGLKLLQSKL